MKGSEASHIGNLSNFDQMIGIVKGYGEIYNPANPAIKTPALEAKSSNAHNAITDLNNKASAYRVAVERRTVLFEPFFRKITRINNLLKSSGTSKVMHEEVAIIIRKLQGARAGKKPALQSTAKGDNEPKQNSVSQLGYDERVSNFGKLISQLELIPEYMPNESDLSLSTLGEYCISLDNANKAVLKVENDLSNCRLIRNKEFYAPETGLTELARADKLYIKALFGANSPQYHQVSGIGFKSLKN